MGHSRIWIFIPVELHFLKISSLIGWLFQLFGEYWKKSSILTLKKLLLLCEMQNWPPDKAQWCEQNCNVIFIQLHFYSSYPFNFLRLLSQWNHTVLNSEWSAVLCYYKPQILGPTFLIYVLKWSVILTSLALKNGVKNIQTSGYNGARTVSYQTLSLVSKYALKQYN